MPARSANNRSTSALTGAIRSARRIFIVIGLFSLVINVLMLVGPLYMLQVYDRVLTSRSVETLLALTVLAVGLIGTNALLELVRSRLLVRLGGRFDTQLKDSVFAAVFETQLRGKSADAGQVLRDMDSFRSFLTGPALVAFFDAPWTPAFIAIIFLFHPWMGMVALFGAVVLFVVAVLSELATRGVLSRSSRTGLEAQEFASSALRGAEVVRAMGMLRPVLVRWNALHSQSLAHHARASDRAGILTAFAKFVRPCLQIAMLGTGAYLVLQDAISSGVMVASSIIMGRALAPVEQAINNWRQFIAARGAYGRLHALLHANAEKAQRFALPRPAGLVCCENLIGVAPRGGATLIRGVNFDVAPGQVLGILGPSGAGKSCLVRLLVGIWPPASGHVRLDGADITHWDWEALGQHIGYLPQDVELFSGTVAENIARLQQGKDEQVVAAAQACGAHEMILALPNGYDTDIGEGGCSLSGGQRQRIGLARALFGDPSFIVLDEPNANLDVDGERALQGALHYLKAQNRTVIVVSHRPSVLNAVDLLLVLRDGRQEAFGARDDVLPKLVSGVRPLSQPQDKGVPRHVQGTR